MKPDNPLYRFRFCPLCGSEHFDELNPSARRCGDCGFVYYTNPHGATVAIIVNDRGELLVGRRANDPAKGTLDLVGGFVDLDESGEEAMCREIREESGLEVSPSQLRYLFSIPNTYPYSGICVKTLDLFFEVRLHGDIALQGRDDIEQLRWVPLSQLNPEEIGLCSVREGVLRYLELNRINHK